MGWPTSRYDAVRAPQSFALHLQLTPIRTGTALHPPNVQPPFCRFHPCVRRLESLLSFDNILFSISTLGASKREVANVLALSRNPAKSGRGTREKRQPGVVRSHADYIIFPHLCIPILLIHAAAKSVTQFCLPNFSVSSGTFSNKSPTNPTSAT
jgi:hypothetical protein